MLRIIAPKKRWELAYPISGNNELYYYFTADAPVNVIVVNKENEELYKNDTSKFIAIQGIIQKSEHRQYFTIPTNYSLSDGKLYYFIENMSDQEVRVSFEAGRMEKHSTWSWF